VSTTLVPPSYYEVRAHGRLAHLYPTIGEAAAAVLQLAPTVTAVDVVTGSRRRSLSDRELRELGRHVRARRLVAQQGGCR
jgi:uroporphyrinogen-III synthase